MKVLVTATVQFEMHTAKCSENQAIHYGREVVEDCMNQWPNDYFNVVVGDVKVDNLDSEDGSFK